MPPMIASTNSCLTSTATTPSAAPSASAPTSPMNTCAGYALNQRKPRPATAIAVQKIASSPLPAMYGMVRYVENIALEVADAKIDSAEATSRAEEHTYELQKQMRISYAGYC